MKGARIHFRGISPYSQSRFYQTPKLEREQPDDYEKRTWRDRMNTNDEGNVVIPNMAFKLCLSSIAKYLGNKVPGKRNATYTKHFESGILVPEAVVLPIRKEDVAGEWLMVPSDGVKGGGKRVPKCFPVIPHWGGAVELIILDEILTLDVLQQHAVKAGALTGIGRFRAEKGGYYGRFKVEDVEMFDLA